MMEQVQKQIPKQRREELPPDELPIVEENEVSKQATEYLARLVILLPEGD